jgi:hypothetical protein
MHINLIIQDSHAILTWPETLLRFCQRQETHSKIIGKVSYRYSIDTYFNLYIIYLGPLKDIFLGLFKFLGEFIATQVWRRILHLLRSILHLWVVFLVFLRHVSGLFWAASCFWSRPKKHRMGLQVYYIYI